MCGAGHVRLHHEWVVGVDNRGFGAPAEQLVGMTCVPLVELVVTGDEHRGRAPVAPAGPPDLLPQRRERAGEAVADDGVETTHIDPELERAGRDHAGELARCQRGFERAPFAGKVAGSVRRDGGTASRPNRQQAQRVPARPPAPLLCGCG